MEEEKDMTPILIEDLGMLYPTKTSKNRSHYGIFKCQYCGKEFKSMFYHIRRGETKSCGCYNKIKSITHGLRYHRFYDTWKGMTQRCYNKKSQSYPRYGGRGIKVCDEWRDVKNFVKWAEETFDNNSEGLTLDRIDNDKGYSPDNCRWADKTTQSINRRKQKNNTSGYVGVMWKPNRNKWVASVKSKGKNIHLGCFTDKMEAVKARDDYIIEHNLPHKLSTDY